MGQPAWCAEYRVKWWSSNAGVSGTEVPSVPELSGRSRVQTGQNPPAETRALLTFKMLMDRGTGTCENGGYTSFRVSGLVWFLLGPSGLPSRCRSFGDASLAQLVEQLTLNQRVEGSSPSGGIPVW